MNCEKCQELLSDFLDDAMNEADRLAFSTHLEECLPCFHVHAELNSVVSYCRDHRGEYDAPPNEQALWLRIRNTVESEYAVAAARNSERVAVVRRNWLARSLGRSWQLSLPQVAAAVVAVVIFASLATVLGLRALSNGATSATANLDGSGQQQSIVLTASDSSPVSGMKNRQWQQQQISFLAQMVEQRKGHWDPRVRADFERNISLLDETVNESLQRLSRHPHDDVTEEMLDAALNDKMQLLKEFSDL